MASVEERMKILKMIEEGKVSMEEGAKLLSALSNANRPSGGVSASSAKWLRVRVTDVASGRSKATVQDSRQPDGSRHEDRSTLCAQN